jgi:DUF2075 family protein/SOS-response transcriptional repressor LexA/predicted GIY-YIG superfamily endonuclease
MQGFNINDIYVTQVHSTGIFEDLVEDDVNFYSSALVYLLNDKKSIYVGESVNIKSRLANHNAHNSKKNLSNRHAIYSRLFNKSVTLHLEAFLINLFSAEPKLKLINANLGNNGHRYHCKEEYEALFPQIWEKLKELKIAKTSFESITNSNVFKYSPYKSLNLDQQQAVLSCLKMLVLNKKGIFIHGNAGTGKTIIAIFVLKLLVTPIRYFHNFEMEDEFSEEAFDLLKQYRAIHGITEANESKLKDQVAMVVSMTSLRGTLQKVFNAIDQLSSRMVISPTDISKRKYKIVLVDEAHRLRQRKNISGYNEFDKSNQRLRLDIHRGTELDWVLMQSEHQVFFYDANQSIRRTDISSSRFEELKSSAEYDAMLLYTQIRSKGGDLFTDFVHRLFDSGLLGQEKFDSHDFELRLFESFADMRQQLFSKNKEVGLSRLVAGFSWEYKTKDKKNRHLYDMTIEGIDLRWNSKAKDWINSEKAIDEVGSIHTVFGNDLNYIAIVFGKEIDYDPVTKSIIVIREHYKDQNGKNSTSDVDLSFFIKNIYKTLIFRGIRGVYLYAINPGLRDYLSLHMNYSERESIAHVKVSLKFSDGPTENSIPYYDLEIAAGSFSELQQSEVVQYIKVSERYKDATQYFACKVVGESMNRVIPSGSICLFEKYQGGSRNGVICLVELQNFIDKDFGANYTIKEYSSRKNFSDEGWQHQEIHLLPKSTDRSYKPIVLRDEETTNLRVIGVFKEVLE